MPVRQGGFVPTPAMFVAGPYVFNVRPCMFDVRHDMFVVKPYKFDVRANRELRTVHNLPDVDLSIPSGGGEQAVVDGKGQGADPTRREDLEAGLVVGGGIDAHQSIARADQ